MKLDVVFVCGLLLFFSAIVASVAVAAAKKRERTPESGTGPELERYDLLPYGSLPPLPGHIDTLPVAPWSAEGGEAFEWWGGKPGEQLLVLFQWNPKTAVEHRLSFKPESAWSEDEREIIGRIRENGFRYVAAMSVYLMQVSHLPRLILTLERSETTPNPLFCEWRADLPRGRRILADYTGQEDEKAVLDFFLAMLTHGNPDVMKRLGTVAEGWRKKTAIDP